MKKTSRELAGDLAAVRAFRSALDEYVAAHDQVVDDVMGWTYWVPKDERAEEIPEMRRQLAELAGRAHTDTRGKVWVVGLPGQTIDLNPIAAWFTAFQSERTLASVPLTGLKDFTDSAIGEIEVFLENRRREERSLAGRVAQFVGFPAAVREAAGLTATSTSGRVATGFAVLLQTVVGGVIATLVATGIIALISLVF